MKHGTPLPAALSGNTIERLVRIDEALIYLVNGALAWLVDKEPLEQTGALTPETAKNALSVMLYTYFEETPTMIPVGATMIWHTNVAPSRWLMCQGGLAYISDYPELFALWGYKYGNAGDQFGLPDMRDRSPMGADGGFISLDQDKGAATHTLTVNEIPPHAHRVQKQSATVNAGVNTATPAARTENPATPHIMTDETGGGASHNNVHPVKGVNFIVYGGR